MRKMMNNVIDKVAGKIAEEYTQEKWIEVSKDSKKYQEYLDCIIRDYGLTSEQVSELDNAVVHIRNGQVVEYKVAVPSSMIWDFDDDFFVCWDLVV